MHRVPSLGAVAKRRQRIWEIADLRKGQLPTEREVVHSPFTLLSLSSCGWDHTLHRISVALSKD